MKDEIVTSDLSKFGIRELRLLEQLLKAMREQGLPHNFDNSGVHPVMNIQSGYVFLTNDDYDVVMMNGDTLEKWHHCSYCGHEGFLQDFNHEPVDDDCIEQMAFANGE